MRQEALVNNRLTLTFCIPKGSQDGPKKRIALHMGEIGRKPSKQRGKLNESNDVHLLPKTIEIGTTDEASEGPSEEDDGLLFQVQCGEDGLDAVGIQPRRKHGAIGQR